MIKKIVKRIFYAFKRKQMIPIPQILYSEKVLDGKIALIVGGNGGIGFAIAEEFIKCGCKVIIAGTDEITLKESVKKLGSQSAFLKIDFCNVNALMDKINEASNFWDEEKIDILVNSAGVANKSDFMTMSEAEYDHIMDINAKGTFFMCQAMAKYMISKNVHGHILNITSSSALRPAWTPYQMSKWAIRGFTLGLADILAPHGITVNAIAPGQTATKMLGISEGDSIYNKSPAGRFIMPSEIAKLAVFLVSDLGDMIIGDTIYITGGSGVINLHM